ncbi:acetate--CoA ligase family protein [Comamonadaceae bacterium G21597-S1]|nr:acetate--CoA ligase family protein [Comamonadaceae bacterium G21597-S1]
MAPTSDGLRRLFAPRHVAVFGGAQAAEVVRQCKALGFAGAVWPVHPRHAEVEGLPCYPDVASLPEAPDASFIAVPREGTVEIVRQLAARGAGGVICYASGFAEVGGEGIKWQRRLVDAAGTMALVGPNCYGMLNYLDGVALWPDQHGGERVGRGVAIVSQSGNIALNLTMQRRNLPLACLVTVGNKAGVGIEAIVDALLQDERISAIGLHIEGLDDVAAFSQVALRALARGVPLVALKAGSSVLGASTTVSHTGSLAGPDALYDALFRRLGIARVPDPAALIETLKLLHVTGPLPGRRIVSASCSGGEASLVADLAQPRDLDMPAIPAPARQALHAALGDKVTLANPLDYHTYIWGDLAAQTACFAALLQCRFDMHLLVLDFPRADRCVSGAWQTTVDAFVAAHAVTGASCAVVASMPEGLPDGVARQLLERGIAPMQGLAECLDAIGHAAGIGAAHARLAQLQPVQPVQPMQAAQPAHAVQAVSTVLAAQDARPVPAAAGMPQAAGVPFHDLDEVQAKQALAAWGLATARGMRVPASQAAQAASDLGFPVVVKAVSRTLVHKTEAGAVRLNLRSAAEVDAAVQAMAALSGQFLVERMAQGAVAEIIVGLRRDAQFGLALTLGAGGVLVELLQDAQTLLLPASRADICGALATLRCWPLLAGYRGRPAGDVEALLDAVQAILAYGQAQAGRLLELDVNPVLVLPQGQGVVAVDAFVRLAGSADDPIAGPQGRHPPAEQQGAP